MPSLSVPIKPAAQLTDVSTKAGTGALSGVSLTVRPGEILTLLGTGGPATVLALLAGYERQHAGEVAVAGITRRRTPVHRRGVGVVARGLALFPHLTVADHAGFAPGVTAARADAVLQRLGLASFAGRRPGALPQEVQLLVALARALAPAPPLLLLDDPLSGLSAALRPAMKALLRAVCAESGLAILHATGDVTAAFGWSDRIGVMQSGRLLQTGTPQELYERPASLAVATSLGPINRLAGTKLGEEDDIARIRLHGGIVVEAHIVDPLADGAACVVAIRPERVAVAAIPASELGAGAIPARLVDQQFEGEHTRLRFTLGDEGAGMGELVANRPSGLAVPRGGAISLAWQPHQAHMFQPEAA